MGWHTSTILKHIANNPSMSKDQRHFAKVVRTWLALRAGEPRVFQALHLLWFQTLPSAMGLPWAKPDNWRPTHDALVAYARAHNIPEDWDHGG